MLTNRLAPPSRGDCSAWLHPADGRWPTGRRPRPGTTALSGRTSGMGAAKSPAPHPGAFVLRGRSPSTGESRQAGPHVRGRPLCEATHREWRQSTGRRYRPGAYALRGRTPWTVDGQQANRPAPPCGGDRSVRLHPGNGRGPKGRCPRPRATDLCGTPPGRAPTNRPAPPSCARPLGAAASGGRAPANWPAHPSGGDHSVWLHSGDGPRKTGRLPCSESKALRGRHPGRAPVYTPAPHFGADRSARPQPGKGRRLTSRLPVRGDRSVRLQPVDGRRQTVRLTHPGATALRGRSPGTADGKQAGSSVRGNRSAPAQIW